MSCSSLVNHFLSNLSLFEPSCVQGGFGSDAGSFEQIVENKRSRERAFVWTDHFDVEEHFGASGCEQSDVVS